MNLLFPFWQCWTFQGFSGEVLVDRKNLTSISEAHRERKGAPGPLDEADSITLPQVD